MIVESQRQSPHFNRGIISCCSFSEPIGSSAEQSCFEFNSITADLQFVRAGNDLNMGNRPNSLIAITILAIITFSQCYARPNQRTKAAPTCGYDVSDALQLNRVHLIDRSASLSIPHSPYVLKGYLISRAFVFCVERKSSNRCPY